MRDSEGGPEGEGISEEERETVGETKVLDRMQRSRAALLERFPDLAGELQAEPASRPILAENTSDEDEGVVVDVDIGSARLYGKDGRELAAAQVAAYLEKPLRFYVVSLRGANVGSGVSSRMLETMNKACADLNISVSDLEVKPRYDGGFLVILGVGLGYHLPELIARTSARHIVIIEPHPDFLRHSLGTIDWAEMLETAEARGCKFVLSCASAPTRIVDVIQASFSAEGTPFIDGAYVFLHYPAWELFEARDRLAAQIDTLFVSRGFYEDELVMLDNTLANIIQNQYRLIDTQLRLARSEPAFLVGSGPSLDHSIVHLKRLRERAVVFSCGSALKALLRHGIIPDFHCELENGAWIYDSLAPQVQEHDLRSVTLIAPLTVDPRVPPLFAERFLYFRDSVSGTRMLAAPGAEIHAAVPTVANVALRLGMGLGFTTFYLFGIDCGAKSEHKKHTSGTIYDDSDQFKKYEDMMDLVYSSRGNFGGIVKSDWVFNFSRFMLSTLTKIYSLKVFNCSDGALIQGATPKVPAMVSLPPAPLDRPQLMARLRAVLTWCEPGAKLPPGGLVRFQEGLQEFRTDLIALLDASAADDGDFVAFWKRLAPFLDESLNKYAGTSSLVRGSLLSMPKIGMFFVHRVREQENRALLYQAFLKEYRELTEMMCDTLAQRLEQLSAELPPVPAEATAPDTPP